jgi:glycine/D-amino acid oxidase-like deaminating enzyme
MGVYQMNRQTNIVIVGGGIWGLSTAYHLARAGCTGVEVLERNDAPFDETTSQAAGLIGQIRATPLMRRAIRYAINLFRGFEKETGHDPGFHQVGSLLLALTPDRMASFQEHVDHANGSGVEARFVDGAEMSRLAPHLDISRVEGAYLVPEDGYLDPRRCARAFCGAAEDLGVSIRTGTAASGLSIKESRVTGVETDDGLVEAGHVVVTAGPWTGTIAGMADHRMAMVPIRHQRVTTHPVSGIPEHHPVVRVTDASCYLRPEEGGYLYGFFEPDPTSYDLELPAEFRTQEIEEPVQVMEEARRRLTPIFPVLEGLGIAAYKRGLTTFAPDGAYLVGPVPQAEGLFAASGCAALGIAGSAAVGSWLAGWIIRGDPGENLSALGPERFGEGASDRDWIRREGEAFYGGYYGIPAMSVT